MKIAIEKMHPKLVTYIVWKSLYPIRKSFRISLKFPSLIISLICQPAVINANIFITQLSVAIRYYPVCHVSIQFLTEKWKQWKGISKCNILLSNYLKIWREKRASWQWRKRNCIKIITAHVHQPFFIHFFLTLFLLLMMNITIGTWCRYQESSCNWYYTETAPKTTSPWVVFLQVHFLMPMSHKQWMKEQAAPHCCRNFCKKRNIKYYDWSTLATSIQPNKADIKINITTTIITIIYVVLSWEAVYAVSWPDSETHISN